MGEAKLAQRDLNLALNYMVIEHVLKCFDIYENITTEHDVLIGLFEKAKACTLAKELDSLNEVADGSAIETLFEKLHFLFGLDREVLFGERQINLGIEVDPNDEDAGYCNSIDWQELNDYTQELVKKEEIKENAIITAEEGNIIEKAALIKKIGDIKADNSSIKEIEEICNQAKKNPLSLNIRGLFIALQADEKIEVDNEDELEDLYAEVFDINNNGVYSLDALIFSIIRAMQGQLEGYRSIGKAGHQEIIDPTKSIVPMPLVIYKNSELGCLVEHIANLGYTFATKYEKLVKFSSIAKEIEHCNEEIRHMEQRLDRIGELPEDAEQKKVVLVEALKKQSEIPEAVREKLKWLKEVYVTDLEKSQALFNTNTDKCEKKDKYRKQWLAEYTSMLDGKKAVFEEQLTKIETALETKKALFSSSADDNDMQCIRELEKEKSEVASAIATLSEGVKRATARATQNKPIPLIIVMEPYYESIPILKYNEGKPRKKKTKASEDE